MRNVLAGVKDYEKTVIAASTSAIVILTVRMHFLILPISIFIHHEY